MLNWDDIKQFLANPTSISTEKAYLECKAAASSLPKDFWKTFSAFSNTQGGFILLGVSEDNNEFKITGVKDANKMVDDLFSQARGGQKVSHHSLNDDNVFYDKDIFLEKKVIAIYVPRAENNHIPVHLNGNITNAYTRCNTGDHKLSSSELRTLLSSYNNNQDSKIIPNTSLSELHLPTLEKFRQYIKNHNSTSRLLALDDLSLLKNINAYQVDVRNKIEGLTYAGLLMFGQTHIIRSVLPHYFLEYKSKETDQRYDERVTCDDLEEGNLFEFYLKVAPKLSDLAKNKHFALNHLTRTEDNLITLALREAFINTLTHADYFNERVTIKISQASNTLVFENPGAMLVSLIDAQNGVKSECRNSILHNMFRKIGLCEREGKGIETIFKNCKEELLTMPLLNTDEEKTTLTLTLQDSEFIKANQELQKHLGKVYQDMDDDLHRKILLLAVLNDGWINHSVLNQKLDKHCHSRDITIALSKLEKKGILLGQGEKKEKFYSLPWRREINTFQIYGNRIEVSSPLVLSISEKDLVEQNETKLEAKSEAKSEAKLETNQPLQAILAYYEIDFDEYGRIIKDNKVIINNLEDLDKNYLLSLKAKVPTKFFNLKKKNTNTLKQLVFSLCDEQFISKRALSELLGMTDSALLPHLKRYVENGWLELAFPQQPTHKDQAYQFVPPQV